MRKYSGSSSLAHWGDAGANSKQALEAIIGDARFACAARALAANMLALSADDKALDGIFKDAGRYVAALWALYLHVSGGLTLPRLKQLCAASGFLSPGRARAMLLYLRYLGYVELLPECGKPARYRPTQRFLNAWRRHLCAALDAARVIEPEIDVVLRRMKEPRVSETFVRLHAEGLLGTLGEMHHEDAFVRVFMNRHAGNQIVWMLFASADAFPPRAPVSISIAETARRFRVSRIHIRRLLDEAKRENLLDFDSRGAVVFTEAARCYIQYLYAGQMAQLLAACARTTDKISAPVANSVQASRQKPVVVRESLESVLRIL